VVVSGASTTTGNGDDATPTPTTEPSLIVDQSIIVKIMLAPSSGKLDLSECNLTFLPTQIIDIAADLEDLSLAGNALSTLPPEISHFTKLKRLQLSGNPLTHLPSELGCLTALEGLWLHGTRVTSLPESIGQLAPCLTQLSLSGTPLQSLPESIGDLIGLKELTAAGCRLSALPTSMSRMTSLTKLALNGNMLENIDSLVMIHRDEGVDSDSVGLKSLEELWLQGNSQLCHLPSSMWRMMPSLKHLSLADCNLTSIPTTISNITSSSTGSTTVLPSLQSMTLYGNPRLTSIPAAMVLRCVNLQYLWLEGTAVHKGPDFRDLIHAVLERQSKDDNDNDDVGDGGGSITTTATTIMTADTDTKAVVSQFKALGLDTDQLESIADSSLEQALLPFLSIGQLRNLGQPGYFKLEKNITNNSDTGAIETKVLVVSFGSAPGVPNWGGLLKRVRAAATAPIEAAWDVLYVVDPHRSWYGGGDGDENNSDDADAHVSQNNNNNNNNNNNIYESYYERLAKVTSEYDKVIMIGDSMGATASLLFSPLATRVIAFCPQVDLSVASIRPACSNDWFDQLRSRLLHNVEQGSQAMIQVHVGNWQHDLDQVKEIGKKKGRKGVVVKIWGVNSHRLAAVLDRGERLLPLVRSAVLEELGCENKGEVRLVNLV
jgi:Leucine-rich repeat (LRR) protein